MNTPVTSSNTAPLAIVSNTTINLVGVLIPVLAAVVGFPALNRNLGTERVGFLTLAWAIIGYFGLFDLGLGRALTKVVAERIATPLEATIPRLVWTGLAMMMALGAVAGISMALAANWLVASVLAIPADMQAEATAAVRILALTVPIVVTTAGLRGVVEAKGLFLASNLIRAPLGVWFVAGPLLLIPLGTRSLAWVAGVLFAGRLAAGVAFTAACLRSLPEMLHGPKFDTHQVRPLLRLGGWMTVSNVISPILVYMDRFLLGSRVSLEAVAWYATPWEVVTKVLLLPGAVVGVLFPLFSAATTSGHDRGRRLYRLGVRYTGLVLLVPTLAIALFAREGLTVWMGAEFAWKAYRVAQVIALGTFLNGIAHIPFTLLQGAGRADMTARIHMLELPIYVAMVVVLTGRFGIIGTAVAWTTRVGLDLLMLSALARRETGAPVLPGVRSVVSMVGVLALFATSLMNLQVIVKTLILIAVLVLLCAVTWTVLLERDGLATLKGRIINCFRSRRT
jgi:O-antigen/teichoic acid export membrane protein